jgi:hypothetical protein
MNALRLVLGALALVLCVSAARADEEETPKDNTRLIVDVDARYWKALAKCRDPAIPRRQLLADFKALTLAHPESKHAHVWRQHAALLARMVREDEERARRPPGPRQLSRREQIADLVFRLRDQTAPNDEVGLWGLVDVFLPRNGRTPAHQLAAFGYDAVPALLDAVEDERLTRGWAGSCPLRVGTCALIVLEKIANRDFRDCIGDYEIERTAAARKKAKAWWKEAQQKGEQRMLTEGTERGDDNSYRDGQRLVERYPGVALNAIAKGVGRSKNGEVRRALLYEARLIKDARVIDLLRQELKGPHWQSRTCAAHLLHRRGRAEGVKAMIEEWRSLPREASEPHARALIECLAETASPKAIAALGAGLDKRAANLRVEVVRAAWAALRLGPSGEARTILEQLLVACLDDTAVYARELWGPDRWRYENFWACELAAHALAEAWSPAVSFQFSATEAERDRQVLGIKNYWRLKQNLRPLGVPAAKVGAGPLLGWVDRSGAPAYHAGDSARSARHKANGARRRMEPAVSELPMAFSEVLAARVRDALARKKGVEEKKMFGGIGFLLKGNMLVGVWKESLIVRLGPEDGAEALKEPHVKEFDITGRAMKGWVLVEPEGTLGDDQLSGWIQRAVKFVRSLPAK